MYLLFFMWCLHTDEPKIMLDRFSYLEWVSAIASCIVLGYIGKSNYVSDYVFAKGIRYSIVPMAMMRSSTSPTRAIGFCTLHLSTVLYDSNLSVFRFADDEQWLCVAIIAYSVSFDLVYRNAVIQQSSTLIQSAYEVFEKMLSAMCDGYCILDSEGFVIGMDQKAATVISWDASSGRVHFDAFMYPNSDHMRGDLHAGLQVLQLASSDGQCLKVESYTCMCLLFPDSLPLILGNTGHSCHRKRCTDGVGECMYVRALRVISQQDTEVWATEDSPKQLPVVAPPGRAMEIPAMETIQDALSESSGVTGSTTSKNSSSMRRHSSLGQRVDAMLAMLDTASRETLARSSSDVSSRRLMAIKQDMKHMVKDMLLQTQEQCLNLLSNVGPLAIVREDVEANAVDGDNSCPC